MLPKDEAVPEARRRFLGLDWSGVALFAATLVALLLFLMAPHLETLWVLGLAVVPAAGFALRELRAADPFIDVRVFAGDRAILATYARSLLAATVSYGYLYGFTQWLEAGRGLSASVTGLVLLSTFLVGILISVTTGRRPEVWPKLLVGGIVQVLVCAALLLVTGASPIWFLVVLAAVLGIPQGMLNLANQNALYHQADASRVGASAGLLRTFMYLGAIICSSASAGFFGARADTGGLHGLALFMLAACVLLVVLVLADRSLRTIGRPQPEPAKAPPREGLLDRGTAGSRMPAHSVRCREQRDAARARWRRVHLRQERRRPAVALREERADADHLGASALEQRQGGYWGGPVEIASSTGGTRRPATAGTRARSRRSTEGVLVIARTSSVSASPRCTFCDFWRIR